MITKWSLSGHSAAVGRSKVTFRKDVCVGSSLALHSTLGERRGGVQGVSVVSGDHTLSDHDPPGHPSPTHHGVLVGGVVTDHQQDWAAGRGVKGSLRGHLGVSGH